MVAERAGRAPPPFFPLGEGGGQPEKALLSELRSSALPLTFSSLVHYAYIWRTRYN